MEQAVLKMIRRACKHLKIEASTLKYIEDYAERLGKTRTEQALLFSAMCLKLESGGIERRLLEQAIAEDAPYMMEDRLFEYDSEDDHRWRILYSMIKDLYRKDPRKFFTPSEEARPKATKTQEVLDELFERVKKPVEEPKVKTEFPWDVDQQRAFTEIREWLRDKNKQVYRLFGYAGTGKTTMANYVADMVRNDKGVVLFAAFGGKAAAVMRTRGCTDASTIHSLIYRPKKDEETGLIVGVSINQESALATADLLIVDEVSMVNEEMARDLLSFGVKILVLGDPKQIKPIEGNGYFVMTTPDTLLTKVHRQAKDNPIIWLATRIRNGKVIKPGWYGDTQVLAPGSKLTDEQIEEADAVICGTNRTRKTFNERIRRINGRYYKDTQYPVKGDKLMCLRNNHDKGLFNGTLWTCSKPVHGTIMAPKDHRKPFGATYDTNIRGLTFKVRSNDFVDADGNPLIVHSSASAHLFDKNIPEPNWRSIQSTDKWDFGYALTGHKAQGSQWDKLVIIEESSYFPEMQVEHFYTTMTRIIKSGTILLTE